MNKIRVGDMVIDLDAVAQLPAGEQAKVVKQLEEYKAKLEWNPLLRYRPASEHHAAVHAAVHTHPGRWVFGGNRAGKTTLGIADDLIQATPAELVPDHLMAYKKWECPFYCRIVAPDMQRTMIPVIWEKLREWCPKELLRDGSFDRSLDKTANCLRLECGCRFDFLSYEMELNKFGGAALHRCHYDEEPPAAIRRECLMRLMDYNGDEIGTMTPLNGITWTYREVWKADSPHVFKRKIAVDENPHVSHEAKERILGSVADDQEYNARRYGDFISAQNMVYPLWRNCLAPVRRGGDLAGWEKLVAMDPGVRAFGICFIAFHPETLQSYTFRAVKLRNSTSPVEDAAGVVKEVFAEFGITSRDDVEFCIDPAARQRGQVNADTVIDELGRFDIWANPAQNDVQAGVHQLRRRMRHEHALIADDDNLTGDLTGELEELMMDIDPNADDGQFKIVKVNDHCSDAWRYGHMERPWEPDDLPPPEHESGLPWWEVASPPPRPQPASSVMGAYA